MALPWPQGSARVSGEQESATMSMRNPPGPSVPISGKCNKEVS